MATDQQFSTTSASATGQSGAFFEQHVGAFYLSLLVVRAFAPILKDCVIDEVHFQTERMGWNTDDILLVALDPTSQRRQLAMQVKRQFSVSSSVKDSKKAILDFWKDFRSNENFDSDKDRLALVVLKGTQTLLHTFNSLLDCARASTSGADFDKRLSTTGLISNRARKYADVVKAIITESDRVEPSRDDVRAFLSVLHVLSLDLNTATAQHEAIAKSLLAASTTSTDPQATAARTWSELIQITGSESGGMPVAASYPYTNLPVEIRERHSITVDAGPIKTLRGHGQITIDGIRTTIGGSITIERSDLISKGIDALNTSQAVVITSPAGAGKSAMAKSLFVHLEKETYCLAFRAEEFAVAHIDATIASANVAIGADRLFAILSTHGRNVIFVESVERLLEASVRDAFSDLLRAMRKYDNLQLVMTCRDYSLGTIQTSVLEPAGVQHSIVEVPPLTDEELDIVAKENANISKALSNPRLKVLLRSPYFLNKAASMDWADTSRSTEFNERKFRQKCWSQVVRKDEFLQQALNRRREDAFLELSVRRAKALRPYVSCQDLDSQALDALVRDDLVTISPESEVLGAPSHDVLEDWATIQWVGKEFATSQESAVHLEQSISGYPALRRGYRKWLAERLISDVLSADDYVLDVVADSSLKPYFKDDTLVCVLQSVGAPYFLSRQASRLTENDAALLIRVVHLLRVACKSTPHWLNTSVHVPSIPLQPQGEAWKSVLNIVAASIREVLPRNRELILGLVEDWSKSISLDNRDPGGCDAAGAITFELIENLQDFRQQKELKRAMKVLLKIPTADPNRLRALFDRACKLDRNDQVARYFGEELLPGLNSVFCCQDFPDEVIRLVKAAYLLTDDDIDKAKSNYHYASSINTDKHFGIRHYVFSGDYFPASAIRGPFRSLLRFHPLKGVNLIIDLLNHAGTWFGEQKWPFDRLEQAWQVTLRMMDGATINQWSSERFWVMYRGFSVSPSFLQSAVMALEDWLLQVCEWEQVDADQWFMYLLRKSNNVAITAEVSSACIAHPDKAGDAGITILSSKDLIQMDLSRSVHEHGGYSVSDMFPDPNVENEIYNKERKKSSALPHRSLDLESLAIKMQSGSRRKDVWAVIDAHRGNLPNEEVQSDEDRIWRLALHRMDVRGYVPVKYEGKDEAPDEGRVYLGPGNIEPDVQAIIDDHAPRQAEQEAAAKLCNWGYNVWSRKISDEQIISLWSEFLDAAKSRPEDGVANYLSAGPGLVASVCVRDHWDSLDEDDRDWCLRKLVDELRRDSDSEDYTLRVARNPMGADRAAAYIVSKALMEGDASKVEKSELEAVLSNALTHACDEVRDYAAEGIGQYLSAKGLPILKKCVGAIAFEARLTDEVLIQERSRPYDERRPLEPRFRS